MNLLVLQSSLKSFVQSSIRLSVSPVPNQGNISYILLETILSFTIVPFFLSLFGIFHVIKKKIKVYYLPLLFFFLLFVESSLISYFMAGQQQYVLRLFPFLTIFSFFYLDSLISLFNKKNIIKIVLPFIVFFLVFSSFFLVHKGFGINDQIYDSGDKSFILQVSAIEQFNHDRLLVYPMRGSFYPYLKEILKNKHYKKIYVSSDLEGLLITGPGAKNSYFPFFSKQGILPLSSLCTNELPDYVDFKGKSSGFRYKELISSGECSFSSQKKIDSIDSILILFSQQESSFPFLKLFYETEVVSSEFNQKKRPMVFFSTKIDLNADNIYYFGDVGIYASLFE